MPQYLDIANSPGMWIACSVIIVVVLFQSIRITTIAFRSGKAIGMTKAQMLQAFRTGITTAIVPSIAILLGLIALIPALGVPFPWMRLAVLGSVQYELLAAGVAAREMGFGELSSATLTGDAFACAVWVMSLGIIFGLLFVAFFTPKIDKLKHKIAGGDDKWMAVLTGAAFFGAVAYLVAVPVVQGGAALVALLGGFFSMIILGAVVQLLKQAWLKEWVLALSIIGGMAATGLAYHYFGIGG